jgi:predicted MPP superfamily phosphohydrolase
VRAGSRTTAALAAVGGATALWALAVEPRWFALRRVTVPALQPTATAPLRLLHLSDLHLAPGQEHRHRFVARCLATQPDLIVCTGDLLGDPDAIGAAITALADPGAPAVCVLGSNDRYGPVRKNPLRYLTDGDHLVFGEPLHTGRLVAGLRAGGWTVLENAAVTVPTAAGPVAVGGLDDPHIGCDDPDAMRWKPDGAAEPPALRLGVVHAPYRRALVALADGGADLVLTGHTHGGQVRIPGVGALTTNSDLPPGRARGLSRLGPGEGGPWLHVSAGLGAARTSPPRLACRPEATLLDVVPPASPRGRDER